MTTQAFNLPPVFDADCLHEIPYFPSEVGSLSEWLDWIQEELAMYDLQGLIETGVARPEPVHPKYHRWVALSIKVGIWLREYLESEIYDKLPGDVAYADDIIRAVGALVEDSGPRGSTPAPRW